MENEDISKEGESNSDRISKLRENPWILSSIILGIVCLILFIVVFQPSMTGNVISSSDASANVLAFAQAQGVDASVVSVVDTGSLYEITLSIDGENVPVYVTKDGENLVSGVIPLTGKASSSSSTNNQPTDVPKTDKPKVELFIWGYCPAGVQAQGPMAEVAKLLQSKADFKAIHFYDGHGAHETEQNEIQACIQNIAPAKYWDYAAGFVANIYSKCGATGDVNCDKTESVKLMNSLGIDSNAIMNCVTSQGASLFATNQEYSNSLNIHSSPTIRINGVIVNVARTADAIKTAVCSAFTTAPEECSQALSSATAASSGSCG